jgi:hypothetical protein
MTPHARRPMTRRASYGRPAEKQTPGSGFLVLRRTRFVRW